MNHKHTILTLSALGSILLLSEPGPAFAVDIPTTLIQTITTKSPTSGWGTFTSPDPSGLAYLSDRGTLLDCDGEVDEMSAFFQGDNLFEINLSGTLIDTHTTTNLSRTGFSNEPVGCGYDPIKHELFISDDDQRRVFHIKPGNDGILFTGDDTRTFFNAPDVCGASDIDAEGVTYGGGAVFIIDGVGAQVWRVTSSDGTYDGTGESCSSFDTEALGVLDPEGGEYDEGNPNHLFVVGKPKTSVSYFTTAGTSAGTLNISAANPQKPAGLAIAPRSTNSTAKSLYIVDRGVDNDSNPSENDGKIYEFSIAGEASGNQPPAVNAGVDQIISLAINGGPAVTNLDGTVTDDALPNPPGTVTTAWSKDSGPGSVIFGNSSAVDTTATFDTAGIYVLRLTADDDGGGSNPAVSNTVQITVNPSLTISAIYISAAADGTTTAITGGLAFSDEDIIVYDTDLETWALYFDGSDVGLGGGTNIDAFHILADQSILLSIAADTKFPTLNGLGTDVDVDDSDILRFVPSSIGNATAGTFEWYFDGSDVGLTAAGEDIDAIAFTTNGKLVISTLDAATPSPAIAGFTPADEDLLLFNDTALGTATSGTWAAFLDGSDVGLSTTSSEDVNGAFIDDINGNIFLTTLGAFSVTGASGGGDDIFLCKPGTTGSATTCTFEFVWDGIGSGLPAGAILDGIKLGPKPSFNAAPVLNAIGNKTVARGSLLTFTAQATDADPGDTLTYSLVNGPVGAVIDAGTGAFNWTPSDSGTYPFTVKVCDDATPSGCDEEAISVSVNSAPVLDAIGNQTVNSGNLLSFNATASDTDIPANTLAFSLLSGAPSGAAITTSGAFSWTPTTGGDFPITVQVCDNATPSLCDSEAITVTVHANPVLAPIGNKTVTVGIPMSFTATATDANAGDILTFSLDGAPADAGIDAASGEFSWTPPATGSFTFIVRVCDNTATPLCDEETITVTVNEVGANNPPVLDPIGNKTVNLGSTLTFTATASDPDPGNTLTFNLEPPIAAGAGITSAGAFSWTPSATGSQDFIVRVCDDVAPSLCDEETITVTVNEVVISTINVRVSSGSDDAEQLVSTGAVDLASSDLELTVDGTNQTVGMRFNSIAIPKGAVIQKAYVQFTVDETPSVTETLQVWGQDADNAATFTTAANNISSRPKTAASATWNPAAWPTLGAAGVDQQTQDIKAVIQEIVDRSGWTSGNSLAVIITGDGNGKRVAESFEGLPSAAPLLHVEFAASGDPGNTTPDVNITAPGTGSTFAAGTSIDFAGTATDTEDGTLTGSLSWTSSIDGNIGSGGSFSKVLTTGTHTITASATDSGSLTGSAQITVTVSPPAGAGSVDIRVNSSSDDAEQLISTGAMDLPSSDLELTLEASTQIVGLRFNLVNIPQGATIDSASIQFTVDEVNTAEVTALTIHGQADDNAPTFTTATSNISSRPTTAASVLWDPVPGWTTVGLAGSGQKTPDLKTVIQEIVSRSGWVSGNSLAVIVNGSGKRVARAFNGVAAAAPLLHVDYH